MQNQDDPQCVDISIDREDLTQPIRRLKCSDWVCSPCPPVVVSDDELERMKEGLDLKFAQIKREDRIERVKLWCWVAFGFSPIAVIVYYWW